MSPPELDERLSYALQSVCSEFHTYIARHMVRITGGQAVYARSAITPFLASSAKGESVNKLLLVEFQRGESGDITAIADNGEDIPEFTSVAHGLADGSLVEIANTGTSLGTAAGAAEVNYDGQGQTVQTSVADSFEIDRDFIGTAPTDRGVWIKDGHGRYEMHRMPWSEVAAHMSDYGNPTDGEVPEGVAILTWSLTPPNITYWTATVQIPDWILRGVHHEYVVELAANGGGTPLAQNMREAVRRDYWGDTPVPDERVGAFRWLYGGYSYRTGADQAFIIRPVRW